MTLSFAILVNAAPFSQQGASSAFHFVTAALAKGHKVPRIFFYRDGIHNANSLAELPQDEVNLIHAWQRLSQEYGCELVVCVAAAQRRGLPLAPGFKISGLGQLIEAITCTDRFVEFH